MALDHARPDETIDFDWIKTQQFAENLVGVLPGRGRTTGIAQLLIGEAKR